MTAEPPQNPLVEESKGDEIAERRRRNTLALNRIFSEETKEETKKVEVSDILKVSKSDVLRELGDQEPEVLLGE
jgi:hypothetical protein